MVKLVMELHHKNLKVVEFMMELHHSNLEGSKASVETLSHGLLHLCELVSG